MKAEIVSVVIPAAGSSERFGETNKLQLELKGKTLLEMVCQKAAAIGPREVIVVAREEDPPVEGPRWVVNPVPSGGMGSSISLGVRAAGRGAKGFLIWPADMPLISVETARAVVEKGNRDRVVRPRHRSFPKRIAHPVLFGVHHRTRLESLSGDRGARSLIDIVTFVDVEDMGAITDIDTPSDFAEAERSLA